MKTDLAYTLQRLGTDYVDIYRPGAARPERADRGDGGRHRRHGEGRLRAPHRPVRSRRRDAPPGRAVHPIVDLQIEYSLISRGIEDEILPVCRELGIGITAYGVLSRGLISGHWSKERAATPGDFRAHTPRFHADNVDQNLALVEALARRRRGQGRHRGADRNRLGAGAGV